MLYSPAVSESLTDSHTADAGDRPLRDSRVLDEVLADGSVILYHTGSRVLMTLNPTAALVWDLCDGTHDEPAISGEVAEVFPAVTTIAADVRAILSDLRSRGMLQPPPVPQA